MEIAQNREVVPRFFQPQDFARKIALEENSFPRLLLFGTLDLGVREKGQHDSLSFRLRPSVVRMSYHSLHVRIDHQPTTIAPIIRRLT